MTNQSASTTSIRQDFQSKSNKAGIPKSQAPALLAGPSLEKLTMAALLDPCLTTEEATLQAHIQRYHPEDCGHLHPSKSLPQKSGMLGTNRIE